MALFLNEGLRDVAIRALKTFIQAFVAVWILSDAPFAEDTLIAAGAAGLSAVWNIGLFAKENN